MTCRQMARCVDAFLDGELPAEQTLDAEQHLASCESCSEQVRFASALRTSIQHAVHQDAAPSAGFETRLAGALRAERERLLEAPVSLPPTATRRRTALLPMLVAAAAALPILTWLDGHLRTEHAPLATGPDPSMLAQASMQGQMNPEQALEELVSYHAAPPAPQITEPGQFLRLEPEVGVPVKLPTLNQYGAAWEGGSVIPMRNQHAAIFRYRISNHPVTVYIYNARRVPLRGVLEPRVVHNQPVHVGERHGYSIAAREQRGVGYAIATDLNDDESAELVSTIY